MVLSDLEIPPDLYTIDSIPNQSPKKLSPLILYCSYRQCVSNILFTPSSFVRQYLATSTSTLTPFPLISIFYYTHDTHFSCRSKHERH